MNLIVLIISILILIVFIINQIIKYRRFKSINNLSIIYDRMEMYFVKNNIKLNKDYIEFLKIFKNFVVNPDFLDIQVLMLAKMATEKEGILQKNTEWFNKTLTSLGDNFKIIFKEFDKNTNEIVFLSTLKPDFIFFAVRKIGKSVINNGFKAIKSFLRDYKYVQKHEEAVSYSGMKLNYT